MNVGLLVALSLTNGGARGVVSYAIQVQQHMQAHMSQHMAHTQQSHEMPFAAPARTSTTHAVRAAESVAATRRGIVVG